jgi:uncharacterized protein (TIGR00725 family)
METSMRSGEVYDFLKICISGAADTGHCGLDAFEKAKTIGREIVRNHGVVVTGATTGFPLWAAIAAKEVGGFSIGFSPASSEKEHTEVYNLPTDYMDIIIYTGFGYPGRDLILTRSSDAVIFGCGRIGTIHEFTIAFEDNKPIGILEADWDTDDVIKMIIEKGNRPNSKVVFDSDPKALVERVMELVRTDKEHNSTFRFEESAKRSKSLQ